MFTGYNELIKASRYVKHYNIHHLVTERQIFNFTFNLLESIPFTDLILPTLTLRNYCTPFLCQHNGHDKEIPSEWLFWKVLPCNYQQFFKN